MTHRLILWLCSCFGLFAFPAHAQFNASVQGTVTDPQRSAIAGAKVTLTNQDTGVVRETSSSEEGFYRFTGLPPGKYTVSVEASGFKTKVSKDVGVSAELVRGFDVALEVGAVAEQVTVTAAPEGLQTENANTVATLTSKEIKELPQIGRDPYELLRLTPGILGDGARNGSGLSVALPNNAGPGGSNSSVFQIENQVQISANGQRVSANNFTIDGVSVNSLGFGGAAVITPNQDSVQEITVLSNSYSAEDGRNSGAQVKVVSKSGTNDFHGGGFFKYQEPNWNAFNKYGGPSAPPTRVNNKFRQFGANIGGPVLSDKLFFFFSYEGLRSNNFDTSEPFFVETAQFRSLVASQRPGSIAAALVTSAGVEPRIQNILAATCTDARIPDPANCQVVPGGLDVGSLTGATGQYVPGSNFNGGGLDGIPDIQRVQLSLPGKFVNNQYNYRVDFARSKDQFAVGSYFTSHGDTTSDASGRSRPQGDLSIQPLNQSTALTWIRTLSPTMLNEARFNFTRFSFDQVTANAAVNFGIPRVEIEGYDFDRIRFGADRAETTPAIFAQNTYSLRDVFSKNIRNHAMKAGFEITWEQDNNNLLGGARPIYSNVRLWNFANSTPIFEGINADPDTGLPADGQRHFRTRTHGFFFQDDWKFRPNLIFNLGLRYEYFTPLRETNDLISNFIRGPEGPTLLTAGRVTTVDELYEPDRNNWAPRLGFAWNPHYFSSRMVVRGGFGVSYDRIPNVLFANTRGNPPGLARFGLCCGTDSNPFFGGAIVYAFGSSNSALSYPQNPALANGIDPNNGGVCGDPACSFDLPIELWGAPSNLRNTYVFSYSLETEYQLPWHLVATAGYQGNAGHKLIRILNQNFIAPVPPGFPFFQIFFPTGDENSNYNSLNFSLRRRLSQGFLFNVYYRYSKSIDQLSNEGPGAQTNQTDPAHHQTEHAPSDFDTTHYWQLYGSWDLPLLRGRTDWLGRILGGWQINSILSAHSGFPWTPNTCRIASVPITNAGTICPTRPLAVLQQPLDNRATETFTTPGGNFPGGGLLYFRTTRTPGVPDEPPGIGRNSQRGPRYFGLDASILKRFGLPQMPFFGEGSNIELRGNFFNLFNKLNAAPLRFNQDETRIEDSEFGMSPFGLAGRVIEFQARFNF